MSGQKNRGAREDSLWILGSVEPLNKKPPLQNQGFKWWEHVTEQHGKYFASLLYEGYSCENQAAEPDYSTAKILGIDYAMQGMAVFSEKIEMEEAGFFLPVKNAVNVEG